MLSGVDSKQREPVTAVDPSPPPPYQPDLALITNLEKGLDREDAEHPWTGPPTYCLPGSLSERFHMQRWPRLPGSTLTVAR